MGALEAALGGDPSGALTALGGVDNFSALPQYASLLGGDLTALNNLASVSAIPPYIALAGGDIDATGGLDSASAVRTFVGSDGVFGTGGIDALLPNAVTGQPGYAALVRYRFSSERMAASTARCGRWPTMTRSAHRQFRCARRPPAPAAPLMAAARIGTALLRGPRLLGPRPPLDALATGTGCYGNHAHLGPRPPLRTVALRP